MTSYSQRFSALFLSFTRAQFEPLVVLHFCRQSSLQLETACSSSSNLMSLEASRLDALLGFKWLRMARVLVSLAAGKAGKRVCSACSVFSVS